MGKIHAVCISPAKGTDKQNVHQANFIEEWGLENDAHAGKWHRQVSLLALEQIEAFRARGAKVAFGAFGENLVVEGFDLKTLPIGTRFVCGDVILELTQIGKECHSGCNIYKTMGDCIMPREGVFCRVIRGGIIKEGDNLELMDFSHFDDNGNAIMVDVSEKKDTEREALACGTITMSEECYAMVKSGGCKKGDVIGVARIAGIMGAKKTSELIPLCHILALTKVELDFEMLDEKCAIRVVSRVKTVGKTGVEMEALTAVNVALLTIYDMCKAIDKSMLISDIHLMEKSGGKSGHFMYEKQQ